ncbi:MAG: glycosyltransferase family 4 protein [Thermodesulfovibrionales bacterium]
MKVLVASLFLPKIHATNAGSRTVAEILRELSESHEIYLATRVEENELADVEQIRQYCKKIYTYPYKKTTHRNIFTLMRLMASHLWFSFSLNRIIKHNRFDLVHIEWVETGILVFRRKIPMVLDAHDIITKPAERRLVGEKGLSRLLHYILFVFIRKIEMYILRKFDVIFTRSDYDRDYLFKMDAGFKEKVRVLPHPAGIDFGRKTVQREENSVLFLGSFKDHDSNVKAVLYFCNEILPLIKVKIPDVRFYIVGYGPTEEITKIAARDKNVIVTGFVEDIELYYRMAKVFVAPIKIGGGLLVKILDAMFAGTPVVSSSIGNEGVDGTDNRHILLADSPSDFADKVVNLLTDEELWLRISKECHVFVSKKYTIEVMKEVLNDTYNVLMASGSN